MDIRTPHNGPRTLGLLIAVTLLMFSVGVPLAEAAPAPVIDSFSPAAGPVGTTVTITGDHFTGTTLVRFKSTSASFTVDSDSQITATVPSGAATGRIKVTTPDGLATSDQNFVVTNDPVITSFSPASGPIGTAVTIKGANFTGATTVKFHNVAATSFTVDSDAQITATVPSGADTGPIRVTTPNGTGVSNSVFTVTGNAPTIGSFSPASGTPGTTVTINGTHLNGATDVRFNGTSAVFTVNSDTKITTAVPAGATTGPIKVTTPDGTATSNKDFTVTGAATISSFSPTSGPVGTSVTIHGTHLNGATQVTFNGVSASFTVNSSTKITATVPSGATTGRIKVTAPAGTATSSSDFKVTAPVPTISSISPTIGRVGASVTISGANLSGATQVRFKDKPATFVVNSATQITATVPAGASTGLVRVTTPAGTGEGPRFTVFHGRSVRLRLRGRLRATGRVGAQDGYGPCVVGTTVQILRNVFGKWRIIGRSRAGSGGFFKTLIPNSSGRYRARILRRTLDSGDICGAARSRIRRHRVKSGAAPRAWVGLVDRRARARRER